MFLAINEMKDAKLKYSLIVGLLVLISYLMYFLSGLAFGLIELNKAAVDKWQADTVLLAKEANSSLAFSSLSLADMDQVQADKVAPLSQFSTVVWSVDNDQEDAREKASVFGIDPTTFLAPNVTEGVMFAEVGEAIIDKRLADKLNIGIGDELAILGSSLTLKVAGLTEGSTYNVAPVIYLSLEDYQQLRFGQVNYPLNVNAFVIQGEIQSYETDNYQTLTIGEFINELPGYRAQNLTFGFMIGFLVVISAIIIGIFMYVLTIQKAPIFGIMKAQGIANRTIGGSVMSQTLLLSLAGGTIGWVLTWLSSLALPQAVPFLGNTVFYSAIFASLVVFSLIGTLFSVRAIVKIDPLEAIG